MSVIKPIAETAKTVTLSRAAHDALVANAEAAIDRGALRAFDQRVAAVGMAAVKADFLPAALLDRLLAGASPVTIWREHRGLSQRALATAAGISTSYLNEIEARRKPGSARALASIAAALRLRVEDVLPLD